MCIVNVKKNILFFLHVFSEEGKIEDITKQEARVPPILTGHGSGIDMAGIPFDILTPPPSQTTPSSQITPSSQANSSLPATPSPQATPMSQPPSTTQAAPTAVGNLTTTTCSPCVVDDRDPEVSKLEERELTNVTSSLKPVEVVGPGPTAASIGIKECVEECMKDDNTQGRALDFVVFF